MTTRRTQAERRAATTEALLEATGQLLCESGYAGTTTTRVAERAGVSRGALLHHYPTRTSLLLAAGEWLFEERVERFRKAMVDGGEGVDRLHRAIDVLWELLSSDSTAAWFELTNGARHDDDLREPVAELARRMTDRVSDTWADTFPEQQRHDFAGAVPALAVLTLEGLATRVRNFGDPAPSSVEEVIDLLKLLSHFLETPGEES